MKKNLIAIILVAIAIALAIALVLNISGCGLIDQVLSADKPDAATPKIVEVLRDLLTTASNTNTYGGVAIGILSSIWIAIRGRRAYKKYKNGKNGKPNGAST